MTGKSLQLSKYGTAATADKQTSPTDTTAGALMEVGAGGLLAETVPFSEVEFANRWDVRTTNDFSPFGGGSSGRATVLELPGVTSDRSSLLAFGQNVSGGRMAFKGRRDVEDLPWQELYHTGNILGTVSQDAIIETGGSDTEGTYTLLKNGLVIFNRVETDFDIEVNEGSGSVFVSPGTDYRLSYPFNISQPVTTSVRVYGASAARPVMWVGDPITSTASHGNAWRFRVVAGSSISSATVSVHLTAIGYI